GRTARQRAAPARGDAPCRSFPLPRLRVGLRQRADHAVELRLRIPLRLYARRGDRPEGPGAAALGTLRQRLRRGARGARGKLGVERGADPKSEVRNDDQGRKRNGTNRERWPPPGSRKRAQRGLALLTLQDGVLRMYPV